MLKQIFFFYIIKSMEKCCKRESQGAKFHSLYFQVFSNNLSFFFSFVRPAKSRSIGAQSVGNNNSPNPPTPNPIRVGMHKTSYDHLTIIYGWGCVIGRVIVALYVVGFEWLRHLHSKCYRKKGF
jgi:hypothetical protein